MRNARALGEDLSKAQQALEDIKEVVPYNKLRDYVLPYLTNKVGRADFVRQIPGASTLVEDKEKETKQAKKKSEAKREKYEKWASGLSIPFPGDKDFEEFQEWKKKQTRKMILGKYLAEED